MTSGGMQLPRLWRINQAIVWVEYTLDGLMDQPCGFSCIISSPWYQLSVTWMDTFMGGKVLRDLFLCLAQAYHMNCAIPSILSRSPSI